MKIVQELVEYCRPKKTISVPQITKLINDGFLDYEDYLDLIHPDASWNDASAPMDDGVDVIMDYFIAQDNHWKKCVNPWILGRSLLHKARKLYPHPHTLKGGALNKYIPVYFRSTTTPLEVESLFTAVRQECDGSHQLFADGQDRWNDFASTVNFLYHLDTEILHDAIRKTVMKNEKAWSDVLQRLQIGETLFPESFLNGFTGPAVGALDMLLHENTHTTYETNKFSWVLKHENIAVLNRMRLLRNRILCIFHFWLLQFSEYALSCSANQGNACVHLKFGHSVIHLNNSDFIKRTVAGMKTWNVIRRQSMVEHRNV